ncbi:HlyD family type I secretion periplasmic adaptor subunit [Amphritea sp. 1_MG-2023]|uniref:HlyD family type I secretion periplasmic adaptor subunit n=1 Tax=Amphritea sp. 1_MG-2023 TaxID=3062670 RepID=UPI0026E30B78|nr:HlyD family type I secretion periplasmic adaptor subunit [Amphritea sp. 1_MG-2023]MDO6563723.1 HlyD family type I secretion periplasmic adaptor subunit [Amphritea sp. 1_MG-2023]
MLKMTLFNSFAHRLKAYFAPDHDPENIASIFSSRLHIWGLSILLLVLGLWVSFFTLDMASRSVGEVIPATLTKPIQHLEGGIVHAILVSEGQRVEKGQPLVELKRVASEADLGVVEKRIRSLEIRLMRIRAQLAGEASLLVPKGYSSQDAQQVDNANQILTAAFDRYRSTQDRLLRLIEQREAELRELKSRELHLNQKLRLLREQVSINNALLKDGLVTKYEQLNLLQEERSLTGSVAEIRSTKQSAEASIRAAQSELESFRSTEVETLETEYSEAQMELEELKDQRLKLTDTQDRLIVMAPSDGTVLNLNVLGPGVVVKPGGTLMNLVPIDDPLVIETRLPVGDVGLVRVGHQVRMELMSGTARGFQPITGEVVSVSADRMVDNDGMPFYKVRVKPDSYEFIRGAQAFRLIPGVRVQVSILVGSRTVISYLFEPFMSISQNALIEP